MVWFKVPKHSYNLIVTFDFRTHFTWIILENWCVVGEPQFVVDDVRRRVQPGSLLGWETRSDERLASRVARNLLIRGICPRASSPFQFGRKWNVVCRKKSERSKAIMAAAAMWQSLSSICRPPSVPSTSAQLCNASGFGEGFRDVW